MRLLIDDIEQKDTLSGKGKIVRIPIETLISGEERAYGFKNAHAVVEVTITSSPDGNINARTEVKQ
jgi:hypothetical protein